MARTAPTIVWFRQDLRVADNPALRWAAERNGAIIPLFIWWPREEGEWSVGRAGRWWLARSLACLDRRLRSLGTRLIVRKGPALKTLRALIEETRGAGVCWNVRYEPAARTRDAKVERALRGDGLQVATFNASLLFEPGTILSRAGRPFSVFTPFHKQCDAQDEPAPPDNAPARLARPRSWPTSLTPSVATGSGGKTKTPDFSETWTPGEDGAAAELERFIAYGLIDYPAHRDRPDLAGTSRLSPHLHWGEVGPRQIWHAVGDAAGALGKRASDGCTAYLRQLVWREFACHSLSHFPRTANEPLRAEFEQFPWRVDKKVQAAWQQGRTGYPLVDAGMRELARTGWMHNRVRMVVASFLVKDLLIPWQQGARWFWDNLVDADLANNTLGWQWAGGCGADAAPFFRIFNPVRQGQRFDPQGDYIRRFLPELADVPDRWIHAPFKAGPALLAETASKRARAYPPPIVDHGAARRRALEAFAVVRRAGRR